MSTLPLLSRALAPCALTCTALAFAAAPAAGQAPKLKLRLGIYDCYSYDSSRSSLDYSSSVKLIAKGRYEHTFGRKGRTMRRKSSGTYSVRNNRMAFKRGALSKVRANVVPGSTPSNPPKFNILAKNGKAAGITCTYVTDRKVNP